MKRWIFVLALTGIMLAAPLAPAQDDGKIPVATITFEPRTYELYKEFAAETLESLDEVIAARETLVPNAPGFMFRPSGEHLGEEHYEVVRAIVSQSADLDPQSGRYVMALAAPGSASSNIWAWFADRVLRDFSHSSVDVPAFEAKRAENDAKMEKNESKIRELRGQMTGLEQHALRRMKGMGIDDVKARLIAVEDAMLEHRLARTEAEARRSMAMAKLEEARKRPGETAAQAHQQKRQYAKERIELAAKAVERVQKMVSQGLAASAELERAEQALAEAKLEAAIFEEQAGAHRPVSPMETQLTGLLVEAEIDLAGLEARGDVLEQQKAIMFGLFDEAAAMEEELARAEARIGELHEEMVALKNWPLNPSDFPVPRPVIQWAQRPGEKEE